MTLDQLPPFFKAIGDPIRLTVLQVLGHGAFGVLELSELLETRQSGMSHHLKILSKAGWVESRREGNSIYYRRALTDRLGIQQQVFRSLDGYELPEDLQRKLADIRQARLQAAEAFFASHADEFELHQERIALFHQYGPETLQLLDSCRLPKHRRALEVGPGKGDFLTALHDRFDSVTGVDISRAMLDQARSQTSGLSHLNLRQADTGQLVSEAAHFDVIVYNMVLHHVPAPGQELVHCAQLLNDGGLLVVTDLCRHDQEWAHNQCGDQWLGFEPDELHQWARAAGLDTEQSRFLALRNGFQVQTQVYRKPVATESTLDCEPADTLSTLT
ncbi:metalloregulator ArsR/SmtB family transcription factor [Saccharospirillum salsuginis]|uniref:Transcriptional regulator n=1 Tax=Saccharospirillum salsuginis TaxID=418750 RepID=A0A918K5A2_9GAMM|nr:metalloregulator ArsR/SmtB family transcription factor [Saccharospirillum salsuginis]GGX50008.1 transcriptional regulator [Saccharospirillum salsuginis]